MNHFIAYTKQYAPSPRALVEFLKDQDGDPHPAIQSPVSSIPPLSPMKAGFAMMPRYAAHHLPLPLQTILKDTVASSKIFLPCNLVNFAELDAAFDRIPTSAFTKAELARFDPGKVLLLRNPTIHEYNSRLPSGNPPIWVPGERYPPIEPQPVVIRRIVDVTTEPPCIAWPSGAFKGMLVRPYKRPHTRGRGSVRRGGPRTENRRRGGIHGGGSDGIQESVRGNARGSVRGSGRVGGRGGTRDRVSGRLGVAASSVELRATQNSRGEGSGSSMAGGSGDGGPGGGGWLSRGGGDRVG
jgi:hypothetical protein